MPRRLLLSAPYASTTWVCVHKENTDNALVTHPVVVGAELVDGDVAADGDVAEKVEAWVTRSGRKLVDDVLWRLMVVAVGTAPYLGVGVVGGDARAHEAKGCGQAILWNV